MIRLCLMVLLLPAALCAQSVVETTNGTGVRLRALDLVTGEVEVLELLVGQEIRFERLDIRLQECRYPTENASSDAFAHLTIRDIRENEARFKGWMVSSSPALYALEHPRYDVWVLTCLREGAE